MNTETARASCIETASCEEGDHSYSWPCDLAPMPAEPERVWSTITCVQDGCGAETTIDPDRTYHTLPIQVWRCNPATSEVWLQDSIGWICDPCWSQLPDE